MCVLCVARSRLSRAVTTRHVIESKTEFSRESWKSGVAYIYLSDRGAIKATRNQLPSAWHTILLIVEPYLQFRHFSSTDFLRFCWHLRDDNKFYLSSKRSILGLGLGFDHNTVGTVSKFTIKRPPTIFMELVGDIHFPKAIVDIQGIIIRQFFYGNVTLRCSKV